MVIVTAMFAIVVVVVLVMVLVPVMMIVTDDRTRSNDDGSSMSAMASVMFALQRNPDSNPHAYMDLDPVRLCRSGRGELSHSQRQRAEEDQCDRFSMFHFVVMI